MKNIICLMGLFPTEYYEEIIQQSRGNVQYAAHSLQSSIISGLSEWSESISIVNLPFIGSFPRRYKKVRTRSFGFKIDNAGNIINGKNVSFCNLTVLKLFSRYLSAKRELKKHIAAFQENVILIYSVHTPFLLAAACIKRRFNNVKIVLAVPDLPEYMSHDKSQVRTLLEAVNGRILKRLYGYVDGYVLLSKYMTEKLPVEDKKWTVMEGIYNDLESRLASACDVERYILYTGTLAKRYGILNLVKAFMSIKNADIKLYICGEGDTREEIIKLSRVDDRIKYLGLVKREQALLYQQNAMLLVNPRTPEGAFTKYSFPSKIMEYLASGVPTLMYRLPGIPDEYYDYCYGVDEIGVECLASALERVINISEDQRRYKGLLARNFILSEKSPKVQTKKILDLISSL